MQYIFFPGALSLQQDVRINTSSHFVQLIPFTRFETAFTTINKIDQVTSLVKRSHRRDFDSQGRVFAFSKNYLNFAIMDTITSELIRGVGRRRRVLNGWFCFESMDMIAVGT